MASEKVTDLTAQTTVNLTDTYHVVNTTDTLQDPAGSSYKITWATIKAAILGYFSATTGITFSNGVIGFDPTATLNFTHATLTSPTITGGTISGSTISSFTLGTPVPQYTTTAKLLKYLHDEWNIPLDSTHIIRHREINGGKTCPGVVNVEQLIRQARLL
jgi:hypothetical protein